MNGWKLNYQVAVTCGMMIPCQHIYQIFLKKFHQHNHGQIAVKIVSYIHMFISLLYRLLKIILYNFY